MLSLFILSNWLHTVFNAIEIVAARLPCTLLKSCADVFASVIATVLLTCCSRESFLPATIKKAQMLPLLKKPGLESSSPVNYRLISNLTTVSKVLERLVLTRLCPHLLGSANFSQFQSVYRKGHSTETALLEVLERVLHGSQ